MRDVVYPGVLEADAQYGLTAAQLRSMAARVRETAGGLDGWALAFRERLAERLDSRAWQREVEGR